jgi:hypothetical protein
LINKSTFERKKDECGLFHPDSLEHLRGEGEEVGDAPYSRFHPHIILPESEAFSED